MLRSGLRHDLLMNKFIQERTTLKKIPGTYTQFTPPIQRNENIEFRNCIGPRELSRRQSAEISGSLNNERVKSKHSYLLLRPAYKYEPFPCGDATVLLIAILLQNPRRLSSHRQRDERWRREYALRRPMPLDCTSIKDKTNYDRMRSRSEDRTQWRWLTLIDGPYIRTVLVCNLDR